MTPPRACPACTGVLAPWRSGDAQPDVGAVALLRCRACGTAVTDAPVPSEPYDSGAYASTRPRGAGLAAPLLHAFDRQRLAFLRRWVPVGGRLLDVGAGRGRFVAHARASGYAADGLEVSRRGVVAAREVYGVELQHAGLEDAVVGDVVDAAVLWHVLEHLDAPADALRTIAGWVRPDGGVLLVGVPNLSSLQARVGGGRWYHLELPLHRTHFTERGVRALLARTGWEVVAVHHVLAEHNPFGLWQSAVNRATSRPSYLFQLLRRNAPLDARDLTVTVLALPLIPLAIVAELLAGLVHRGGTIAVVARRPQGSGPTNAQGSGPTH